MKEFERCATNTGDWCRFREVIVEDFVVEVPPVVERMGSRHAQLGVDIKIAMSLGLEDELMAICRNREEFKCMLGYTPLVQPSHYDDVPILSTVKTFYVWEKISGHCKKQSTINAKIETARSKMQAILDSGDIPRFVSEFVQSVDAGFKKYCEAINLETLQKLKTGLNTATWAEYADSLGTTEATRATVKALQAKVQALESKMDAAFLVLQKQREEAFVVKMSREGWKITPEGATIAVELPTEYVEATMGLIATGEAFKHRLTHSHVGLQSSKLVWDVGVHGSGLIQ